MAAGFIKGEAARRAIVRRSLRKLKKVVEMLESSAEHPDSNARVIEAATALIDQSLGQRSGEGIDTTKDLGLEDLNEHYFS